MDGLLDGVTNGADDMPTQQKNHTLPRTKRVHFSTQNSMVQVPRNITTSESQSPPPPPPPPMIPAPRLSLDNNSSSNNSNKSHAEVKNISYDIQSIYSNEYEPIGSENNSSNYYIDMDSKLGTNDDHHVKSSTKYERSNTPPDLPPKPPNLMKFKKPSKFIPPNLLVKAPTPTISNNESEPDYCSISEINEQAATASSTTTTTTSTTNTTNMTTVQIVAADVHKGCDEYSSTYGIGGGSNKSSSDSSRSSSNCRGGGGGGRGSGGGGGAGGDADDESFADVPKLPNVAAIISPKKETINKFITQDNYVTKSPVNSLLLADNNKKPVIASILNELNSKKLSPPPKIKKMSSISESLQSLATLEDKTPIQAEFDWYNLDAEYGKSNQPDVIRESEDSSESSDHQFLKQFDNCSDTSSNHNNNKVEYNLDEEFNLVNQPDIIKKIQAFENGMISNASGNNCGSLKRNIRTTDNYFTINSSDSPKQYKSHNDLNYDTFLDESGLSSKPLLPRHKKFYYSGSFV